MSLVIDIPGRSGEIETESNPQPPQNNWTSRIVKFLVKLSGKIGSAAARLYGLSVILIFLYLIIGAFGYYYSNPGYDNPNSSFSGKYSNNTLIDGIYFTVVTLTTVGYGDLFPITIGTMCFTMALALFGNALNSVLFVGIDTLLAKIVRRKRSWRLTLACVVFALVGFFAILFLEGDKNDYLNAIYLTVISLTTVGYGDVSFKTQGGRVFASFWLFFGTRTMIHFNNDVHPFILEKLRKFFISVIGEERLLDAVDNLGFKLLIIGDANTGKTTFLKRFLGHEFNNEYDPTLAMQVYQLELETTIRKIRFNCLDTVGSESLEVVGNHSHTDVKCAIIMFDMTNPLTYQNVQRWHYDLCKVYKDIPIVLCGNKIDARNKGKAIDVDLNVQYYEISAKSLHNIEKPLLYLGKKLVNDENLQFVSPFQSEIAASSSQPAQLVNDENLQFVSPFQSEIAASSSQPARSERLLDISCSVPLLPDPQTVDYGSFELIIVGNGGTGKTSFLKRNMTGEFEDVYSPTFGMKVYPLDFFTNSGKVRFNCWDTGFTQNFPLHTNGSYIDVKCAIIMFDAMSKLSYLNIQTWHRDLFRVYGNIPIVLCRNKIDADNPLVKVNDVYSHMNENLQNFGISSKNNFNIEKPFLYLARKLVGDPNLNFVHFTKPAPAELQCDLTAQQQHEIDQAAAANQFVPPGQL